MRHASLARLFAACAFGWLGAGWPASARTLNEILDRGAFTICVTPDALPSSSRDAPEPGFLIELAQMIARQLGVRLDTDWIEFTRTARSVNCDAIMAVADDRPTADVNPAQAGSRAVSADGDASRPKIRRQALTRPYAQQVTRIVARDAGPPIGTLDDLRKIEVAAPPGSYAHYKLDTAGVHVRTLFQTEPEILDAVASGQIAAGAVPDWYFGWYRQTHPGAMLHAENGLVIDPELDYNVCILPRNTDEALVRRVDPILTDLIADGTMARLFRKYGIAYLPPG